MKKMKKGFAMLLCLCLLWTCALAQQTGDDVDAVETQAAAIENGMDTALGNTGVYVTLPGDWTALETPQGYLAAYQNANGTVTLNVLLGQKLSECHNQIAELEEAGNAKDVAENYINQRYYLTYASTDDLYRFAYLPFSDDNCIIFCFGLADGAASMDVPYQILGSAYME